MVDILFDCVYTMLNNDFLSINVHLYGNVFNFTVKQLIKAAGPETIQHLPFAARKQTFQNDFCVGLLSENAGQASNTDLKGVTSEKTGRSTLWFGAL